VIDMCPADHGKEFLVEDRGGKRRYRLSTRELLREGRVLSVDDGPHSDDEIDTAGVILANLTAEQLAGVNEKAAHVREVTTGYRSGTAEVRQPWEPRAEYAPDLPLGVRYQAKAIEVRRDPGP
jgi:hypothetical protein